MPADDERFKALVRSALRDEIPDLPVRITAAELRARAGARRGRWSFPMTVRSLITALAPVTVVVVAALIAFGPTFGPAAPTPSLPGGSSVALPSATPIATVAPTLAPTAAPTPTPVAFTLGTSGDWIFVSTDDTDRIRVTSVGASGVRLLYDGPALFGYEITGDRYAVSPHGLLAIDVEVEPPDGVTTQGTWLVDMRDPRVPGQLLPGWLPSFGPSGDLVTFSQDRSTNMRTVNRFIPSSDGVLDGRLELFEPEGVTVSTVFAADGSGLFAVRHLADPALPVVLRWDGTVVERAYADAPFFATGVERSQGAAGEWVSEGCDASGSSGASNCAINWNFADGTEAFTPLPANMDLGRRAWTRDGRMVVFTSPDGDRSALYAIRSSDRDTFIKLSVLPAHDVRITGMTEDAAIVTLESGESIAVALDGSGTFGGRHPGTLALIIP